MEDCDIERRLPEALLQLKNETLIFERLMYKNVNQHRRALYFRRLCQVRRDLRLLQSANLSDLIQNTLRCFQDSATKLSFQEGNKQIVVVKLEVLDIRRRLYGVSRLLEQMYNPIINASLQIAGLLGRTFFMPFSLAALAILARLRVLVVQCLHDFVRIFNEFSGWAVNKGLIDHKAHTLPRALSFKWDDMKPWLVDATTEHLHELHTESQHRYVEDQNGQKYMVLDTLALGETANELAGIANGVKLAAQSNWPLSAASDGASKRLIALDERADGHDTGNTAQCLNTSSQVIQRKGETDHAKSPLVQDKVPLKEGVQGHSNSLSKQRNSKARNDFLSSPKVAYVSIFSNLETKSEKKEETTPLLKKQRKDSLFDMLLGLGDETNQGLF